MAGGFVYLLGNDAMRGIYKIGSTEDSPFNRAHQLSMGTATPWPFQVIAFVHVDDHLGTEALFHRALDDFRVSERREFFAFQRGSIPWLVSLFASLPCAAGHWVNPDKCGEIPTTHPWAFDPDSACLYIASMTPHAPIHITDAAEMG